MPSDLAVIGRKNGKYTVSCRVCGTNEPVEGSLNQAHTAVIAHNEAKHPREPALEAEPGSLAGVWMCTRPPWSVTVRWWKRELTRI